MKEEKFSPNPSDQAVRAVKSPRVWPLFLIIAAALYVPYKFWRQTRFAESLTDAEIRAAALDEKHPRAAQHALVQISERINKDPKAALPFVDVLESLVLHEKKEVRSTAAWVLGQGDRTEYFHALLKGLSHDSEPLVRYNAALGLAAYGDAGARSLLRAMLSPHEVLSPLDGVIKDSVGSGQPLAVGTALVVIQDSSGLETRIPSPLGGKVSGLIPKEGEAIRKGDRLCLISPSIDQVWEALRGLFVVGTAEDLSLVQSIQAHPEDFPEKVQKQAELTAEAIQERR